jgi:aryl-alcohol dehydrogenase-like predicted oxidoreductase
MGANEIILGTCDFNFKYNNSIIEKKECFKILDFFYKNNGRIIDTAYNYHGNDIIKEWLKNNPNNEMKVITKIWNYAELDKSFEQLGIDKIYCVMLRDSKDEDLLSKVKHYQNLGWVGKVGASIYYENELSQKFNSFMIPADLKFMNDIRTMLLHADVIVRSLYNFIPDKTIQSAQNLFSLFKRYEREDLHHKVEALIGVSNWVQLNQNMEVFK